MWVYPAMRTGMQSFCEIRSGGPEELKPFINALQGFFSKIENHQQQSLTELLVTDSDAVRIELFKLNYMRGEFVLNEKADAQECLNFILTQMHTWMQTCTTKSNADRDKILNKPAGDDITVKLESLANVVRCEYTPAVAG